MTNAKKTVKLIVGLCFISTLAVAQEATKASEKALPNGMELMQKFITATGGKEAYSAVKTEAAKANMIFKQAGLQAAMSIYTAQGGKQYVSFDLPGMGKFEAGSDGTTTWERSVMMGPRLMPKGETGSTLLGPDTDTISKWAKAFEKVETLSKENVAGAPCYLVRMTPKQGGHVTDTCFDVQSGYLVKLASIIKTQMGEIPVDFNFSDYRQNGPIKTAHRLDTQVAGQPVSIEVTDVVINGPVPEGTFDLPADVKALKAKKSAAAKAVDEPFQRPTLKHREH